MPIAPDAGGTLNSLTRQKTASRFGGNPALAATRGQQDIPYGQNIISPRDGESIYDDEFKPRFGAEMVKLVVRDRETIQEAVRRFRKLVERSGIKKELRRREYYEKPSETNRRARLRAERRARRTRMLSR
ncbi:30S ribosomal protein S21 [Rubripirellula amarantea]|uniref:Small ribosomal subunit protein bS21 n=2 Tax=Rubripirellula amarantea TaxID=2527999 RepID=A0A5C5WG60_9BACT|nr:30S ribosomal protein S21 [Rubripirellula amarantea]